MRTILRVTTTRDQFDGKRDNGFSLREAIQVANNNSDNEYTIILESGKYNNLTLTYWGFLPLTKKTKYVLPL